MSLLAVAAGGLVACTKSTPTQVVTSTIISTITATPTVGRTAPVNSGPTTSAIAASCQFLVRQNAAEQTGMRLDRITTQSSGGKLVGCRLYALQHITSQCDASCLAGERLPPANQPAVEIESTRYASATAARTAIIRIAEAGTAIQQDQIAAGITGLCYQTEFWPKDAGQDWACTFSKGSTVVVICTVVTAPALNVVELARAAAPKF